MPCYDHSKGEILVKLEGKADEIRKMQQKETPHQ